MKTDLAYRWDLFWMLTRTEFRLRDQGTMIGFLWTLLHPLFMFMILYLLFTHWMAPLIPNYAGCLLIGIVQWNFFLSGTDAGLTSLRRKAGLVANYSFPRILIVLSSVCAVLLSHLIEWAVLLAALLIMGLRPTAWWLMLPLIVALELALVTALSCLLSVLAVELRDLDRVWSLLLYGFFFLTPVFYTAEAMGGPARRILAFNPLAWIIEATRAAVIGAPYHSSPRILLLGAAIAVFCALSLALFPRMSRSVAQSL
ncbi:MAG: ABC transporter permease [Elusimicrobiota bacterium]